MMMRLVRKPRLRFLLVYPLVVWLFLSARTTEASLRLGIVLVLLGEAIRLWANGYVGHVKVNQTDPGSDTAKRGLLITAGPYAYVQHPLYLGTFLIGVGMCVVARNPFAAVGALVFFLTVYRRKMRGEEEVLLHEWGAQYRAYHQQTPRWWPTGRRSAQRHGHWSWQGIWASKEIKTLLWAGVCLIALYLREEIIQEGQRLAALHEELKYRLWLGLLAVLIVADFLFELARKTRYRPAP